jgi:putative transposase
MTLNCKYCHSPNVVKFGKFEGIQRYWCKDCKRKFTEVDNLPKMKTDWKIVASALDCYFRGMPLDSIQGHLSQEYGLYMSEAGIYNWIIRFAKEAVKQAKNFRPDVGSVWCADETMLNVGNRKVWFWDIIDIKSRYLLASHISEKRTIEDAMELMQKAAMTAGKAPRKVLTDKLAAYLDGIELAFGADTQHVQSKPFTVIDSTNIIERFHGTLKERTKVIKSFKNMETAKLLTDAWLVHYNFFKEHESLGNLPPAQKMGIKTPFKDWADVLRHAKQDMVDLNEPHEVIHHLPIVHTYSKPAYHSRLKHKSKKTCKAKGSISPISIVVKG